MPQQGIGDAEVAFRILVELLSKDEQAVQRRAELMGHIGQELRFVFGGEGKLLRLFFQGPAGFFDFFVLGLHLILLFDEQKGFILQFIVRSTQLFLLYFELAGQGLGLGEQFFRPGVGFDGIEHDPDALDQLAQEVQVGFAEDIEGGEFDNGFDLVFE